MDGALMTTLTPPDPRKAMRQNLTFLREYAKRVIVEGAVHPDFLRQRFLNIVRGVRKNGKSFNLTDRDVAMLIYKGVLPKAQSKPCRE